MIFILLINILSYFLAKSIGTQLQNRNLLPSHAGLSSYVAYIVMFFFSLHILLGLFCHIHFVGKYSDVVFYIIAFVAIDILVVVTRLAEAGKRLSIVLRVYMFFRHLSGVLCLLYVLLIVFYFHTFFMPTGRVKDEIVVTRLYSRSNEISVFGKYYLIFSKGYRQNFTEVEVYERYFFVFKVLKLKHPAFCELSDPENKDTEHYKYTRQWKDTMFVAGRKLYYDEKIQVKDVHYYTTSRRVVYPSNTPAAEIAKCQAGLLIVHNKGKYCFLEPDPDGNYQPFYCGEE